VRRGERFALNAVSHFVHDDTPAYLLV
jgi:hypothetical protein